jgi:hypothetical protein
MCIFVIAASGLVAPTIKPGHCMVYLVGKAAGRHVQQLARVKFQVGSNHIQKTAGT